MTVTFAGTRNAGGRFWALAANDDEDGQPEASSPTPSDLVCESLLAGYTKDQEFENSVSSTIRCEYGTASLADKVNPARVLREFLGFPSTTGRARRIPALIPTIAERPPGSAPDTRSEQIAAPVGNTQAASHRAADGVPVEVQGQPRGTTAGVHTRGGGTAAGAGRGGYGSGAGGSGCGGGGGQGYRNYGHNWNEIFGGRGGGRGNWNAGGGHGGGPNQWHRPFHPPEGSFVKGARGTNYRPRGGGGGRTFGRNNNLPKWKEVTPAATDRVAVNNSGSNLSTEVAPKAAEDRDQTRANKAARKKEKLTCYRCEVPGLFVVDCTTALCDICQKSRHEETACPLLLAPKPVINIYGVCQNRLMFFETPRSTSVIVPPRLESSRTGLIKVTNGSLSADQVSQQLRRLVSKTYQWATERLDDHSFQVEFPRREDLQRLLTFGVSRVSGSKCLLEFEECKKLEPQGSRLQKVWIRFSGIPKTLLNYFLIVWSLGSLIGKTEKVDMTFTRKRGIARLLVMVLDVEYIPDFAAWSYDGVHYDLDVEVEVDLPPRSNDGDVDMTDGDERDKDQGDTDKDKSSDRSKDSINPSSSSTK
ncbi:hypothetical protein D1007_35282 [Hordeum vulgare]|nr:hypothetical protein D1007_35282 [Hordeum vulgare]